MRLAAQHPPNQPFAMAVPVGQRAIEERDPLVNGFAQRIASLGFVESPPLIGAESPATEADFADVVSGRPQRSGLHHRSSRGVLTLTRLLKRVAEARSEGLSAFARPLPQ